MRLFSRMLMVRTSRRLPPGVCFSAAILLGGLQFDDEDLGPFSFGLCCSVNFGPAVLVDLDDLAGQFDFLAVLDDLENDRDGHVLECPCRLSLAWKFRVSLTRTTSSTWRS